VSPFKTDRSQARQSQVRLQDQSVVARSENDSVVFRLIGVRQIFYPNLGQEKDVKNSMAFVRVIRVVSWMVFLRGQEAIHETTRNHTKNNKERPKAEGHVILLIPNHSHS
jgi:hypothetical protein